MDVPECLQIFHQLLPQIPARDQFVCGNSYPIRQLCHRLQPGATFLPTVILSI